MIKIDHIGIAVKEEGILEKFLDLLGVRGSNDLEIPPEGIRVRFFQVGNITLELMYPLSDSSTVKKFIDKRGPGLHHIAFEVKEIEKLLSLLKQASFQLIDETPRIGAEGYKAAFVHPKSLQGILIELVERLE